MDGFLDDLPSEVKAPARSKFQPKAKPRPRKGSVSVPSVSAIASHEQPVTSVPIDSESNQFVQPNDIDGNLLVEAREVVGSTIIGHSENSISKSSEDEHLNADTSLGIKPPEDTIGQSTIATNWPAETPTPDVCTTQIEEDMSTFPDVDFASTSPFRPCSSIPNLDHDTGHYKATDDFSCGEAVDLMDEADAASGKRAVKFQPKPRAQSSGKKDSDHVPYAPKDPSENQHMNGCDSIGASDGEFYVETTTAQPDSVVSEDIDSWVAPKVPEESGDHGNRNMSDAFNFSHESLDKELISSGIEAGENEYVFLDGGDDGTQYHSGSYAEVPNEPTITRDESIEDDPVVKGTSKKKRQQKQKEIAPENEKPARKRRKESKAPDESTEKTRKKFPHATRRKRSVNKALLEAPEDEIDLQRVPIRDLIILAEYRERQAKKDAAMVQPPSTDARNDSTIQEDHQYDEDETFGSDQDEGSLDNPSISKVLTDSRYFNYQSHTKRSRVRWSKQDTELFYQGIRQFGSDLSLIEQLFPDRDRKQIKLKFKNEERQHPMRLNDALSSRSSDHSHFELVIKKLQERAAKEKAKLDQMSGEDDSVDPTGEEEGPDEGAPETDDVMAAKSEQNEDISTADQEPNKAQVASPAKSYDSDDDFDWGTYQSQI